MTTTSNTSSLENIVVLLARGVVSMHVCISSYKNAMLLKILSIGISAQ